MKKFKYSQVFMIAIALVISAAAFQTVAGQAKKKPKIVYYSIKAGTTFHVRLEGALSSKNNRVGDTFRTTTMDPVYSSNGVILIPDGSTISGRVSSVTRAAKNGNPGSIGVDFTSITLPNRRRVAINGMPVPADEGKNIVNNEGTVSAKKTSNRNLKFIGGGAAGGAVIGGIAGGGTGAAIGAGVGALGGFIGKKMSKGKEAEVKSGTEFGVYLNRNIALPRYAPARQ